MKLKGLKCILSLLLACCSFCLFISIPAHALDEKGDFDNWNGSRTYKLSSEPNSSIVRSDPFSGTTGSIILGTGYTLYGFNIGQSVNIGNSTSQTPLYYNMVLNINESSSQATIPWWRLNADSDPNNIGVSCVITDNFNVGHVYPAPIEYIGDASTGWQISWRCRGTTSDFNQVKEVRFYIGDENGNTIIGQGKGNDIILVGASYHFRAGNEASADILNQQVQIQEQIRDGVGQTTDAINNLNDSITDSTITGDFSISPIQPFGPIAAITQGILGLPAVILNINQCTEITPELPYVHEEITIPCPSTILRGMMGDFMDYLDIIASAYIWFITARLIFKKVQDMRDPTNEDEEYLDL